MAAKFEIFLDRKKQYRFHLKASNGEIIAASEAYDTKAACIKGIKSIQKNAPTALIIDPEEAAKKAVKAAPAKRGGKAAASHRRSQGKETPRPQAQDGIVTSVLAWSGRLLL
jgi:uncharacterized protein YegP (UPF0339 family)